MKKISLYIITALFGLLFFNSCIDDDYAEPEFAAPVFEVPADAKLISISEFKDMYFAKYPSTDKYLKAGEFLTIEEDIYISGYAISNDVEGNFYKALVIQGDLDGQTEGMVISLGESNLSNTYAIGQKVFIKCQGLVLGKYGNEVQLGGAPYYYKYRGSIDELTEEIEKLRPEEVEADKEYRLASIPSASIDLHIFKDGLVADLNPSVRTITEILENKDLKFTYITINNIQFELESAQTWGKIGDDHNKDFPFNPDSKIIDIEGQKLTIFTSNYSKFAYKTIPVGSGSITGVLSYHDGSPQFVVNSLSKVKISEDKSTRFVPSTGKNDYVDANIPTVTKTIAELQALYSGSTVTLPSNFVIEGTVISNQGNSGNFYNQLYIQDVTGGMQLRTYKSDYLDGLALGQKIVINASEFKLGVYKGVMQLGVDYNGGVGGIDESKAKTSVYRNGASTDDLVSAINIDEVENDLISTLVKLDNVQFKSSDLGKTYSKDVLVGEDYKWGENRYLIDADGNEIVVRTANQAVFHNVKLPEGNGSIVGILSKYDTTWQLLIRNTTDLEFESTRF